MVAKSPEQTSRRQAKAKKKTSDDKEYVIATISRSFIRELLGAKVANKLSDDDMERIAYEMNAGYTTGSYEQDLREIIEERFSD